MNAKSLVSWEPLPRRLGASVISTAKACVFARRLRTTMTYKLPPDVLDRDLVLSFFWKFSVFECALKREGFLRTGPNNAAQPDWDRFGRDIRGRFRHVSFSGFRDSVEKLESLSPRRQVVRDGRLAWEAVKRRHDDSEEAYILRLLRTTRNNLFHGGKYPDGHVQEVTRDRDTLRSAMAVLDGCFEIHAGVKRWVDEAA